MNLLLSEILSSPWMINKERAAAYASFLVSLFNGESVSNENEDSALSRTKNRCYVTSLSVIGSRYAFSDSNIPERSIAVIPIRSEIMKYDQFCGPRGSLSIMSDIQAANDNPKIKSILIVVDSPGGQVSFTDILAEKIKNSKTPIIAYVEGMAASAAYWIVSGAKRIIASSDLDRIGSIGTMMFFADLQPYYEDLGVKFHEFYASLSTDKNQDINKVLKGNYDDYIKSVLDPINNKLIASVKSNRSGLDESTLTGKVYFAPEAITLGLIDEIGPMEYALKVADEIEVDIAGVPAPDPVNEPDNPPEPDEPEAPESKNNIKSNDMNFNKTWKAIVAFFKIEDEKAEQTKVTPEMMQQLNDRIVSLEGLLSSEQETVKSVREELVAEKQGHQATKDEFEAFKNSDAGKETIAAADQDHIPGNESKPEFAHNKEAEKFLEGKK
jgi:signal peptide peptidase SppA